MGTAGGIFLIVNGLTRARTTVVGVTSGGRKVSGLFRKLSELQQRDKPVGTVPPWSSLHFLPPESLGFPP